MRTIFSRIDESLRPPFSMLCNRKENVSLLPKPSHKKPKSITQLSKQSRLGRVPVSIVMQSNMAAVATRVFCQVNTGREVNAFQMFAERYRGTHSMQSVINHAMVLFCLSRTVDMRLNVTDGPI